MFIQPIDYFLAIWFLLAIASALWVAIDMYRNTPEPAVMKWGFILVTLYMGPLGLLMYVLACKEPRPGTHEAFVEPLWKQGVGSTIHCVAGDATGIILAATLTAFFGYPMIYDILVEYIVGFAVGLLIFQALFMQKMMGGTYWENVRASFAPELISMNAVMAGMVPTMVLLMMGRDMRGMEPTELMFWGIMSLGVIVGFIVALPVNIWMVSAGMKHGMMTLREPGGRFDVPVLGMMSGNACHPEAKGKPDHGQTGVSHEAANPPNQHSGHGVGSSAHATLGHEAAPDHAAMGHGAGPDRAATGNGAGGGHTAMSHGKSAGDGPPDPFAPTHAQVTSLILVSSLMFVIGVALPSMNVNVWLGAREVGGLIMPPGMIMDFDTPADAMRDMAAVSPREVSFVAEVGAQGDQTLTPRIEDGVKFFDLTASVIRWNILEDETVEAFAYNRQIPGPRIAITEGDRIRINFRNDLPEPSTIHWHGMILPNEMDGPADVVQEPVLPGGTFVYEFTVEQSGTYFYHTHASSDRQQGLGLYGALIVEPANAEDRIVTDHDYTLQLQEWLKREWLTYPAMIMEGALPNFFTINGKAYPDTDVIRMKVGETVRLRFVGTNNNFAHPMHVHGGPYTVVAIDGEQLRPDQRYEADSVSVAPGQRVDVVWTARKPGKWLIHCHIPHHTTNNNVEVDGAGGLTMYIEVT